MERKCKLTPRNTAHLGAAAVSADMILEVVTPIAAEKKVDGKISSESQKQLNDLCFSARVAGSVDDQAFVEAMEKVNLTVDCSQCKYHR